MNSNNLSAEIHGRRPYLDFESQSFYMLGIHLGRTENKEEFATGNHGVGCKTTTRKKMGALKIKKKKKNKKLCLDLFPHVFTLKKLLVRFATVKSKPSYGSYFSFSF